MWVATDENGSEFEYDSKPKREAEIWWPSEDGSVGKGIPSGSIQKLIGIELDWTDECVEI